MSWDNKQENIDNSACINDNISKPFLLSRVLDNTRLL